MTRYFIDLDWYQKERRAFAMLAQSRLCPSCRQKHLATSESPSPAALIQTLGDCYSHSQGFITASLPLMEAIFRLFLASYNQPLDLEQIHQKLQEQLASSDSRGLSPGKLQRLIDHDRYYGLHPFQEAEAVQH